ncbi:MAG: ABC transporter ATP-binding protein [Bacillota bacterium]
MLVIEELQVSYGAITALHGISLEVREGEIVALIGANGAGKSTTLRTISGLVRPAQQTSRISFRGETLFGHDARGRHHSTPPHRLVEMGISHVPEGRRIFPEMTVRENLLMGAYSRRDRRLGEAFERVYARFPRLKEREGQVAGTLSGGEQQMLSMGRALMSRPRLMLMDEPSMGLAPMLVEEIFSIIDEINADGTTVLLVEQNAQMALSIADRAYVLETGRIALAGAAEELARDESVRKAYLGE